MSTMLSLLILAMCMSGQLFPDLFSETTSTVGHFLSQLNPDRVAKSITWVKSMRLNRA